MKVIEVRFYDRSQELLDNPNRILEWVYDKNSRGDKEWMVLEEVELSPDEFDAAKDVLADNAHFDVRAYREAVASTG